MGEEEKTKKIKKEIKKTMPYKRQEEEEEQITKKRNATL